MPTSTRVLEQGKRVKPRGFRPEPPRGRVATGAAEAEAERIRKEGIRVSLGESTLSQLLDIKVPLKDVEGNIVLDSAGKPVMTTVRVNIGDLNKSFSEKIDLMQASISSGDTATREGLARISALIMSIPDLKSLKGKQREDLAKIVLSAGYKLPEIYAGITGLQDGRYLTGSALREGKNMDKFVIYAILMADVISRRGGAAAISVTKPIIGVSGIPIFVDSVDRYLNNPTIIAQEGVVDIISLHVFDTIGNARAAAAAIAIPDTFIEPDEEKEADLDIGKATDHGDLADKLEFTPGDLLSPRQKAALEGLPKTDTTLVDEFRTKRADPSDDPYMRKLLTRLASK